ncbi:MAG: hypothetical protein JWN86_584 [Planctomycetota bacterium]|nr:hypothetical protein [Planctomycetota bacterium]
MRIAPHRVDSTPAQRVGTEKRDWICNLDEAPIAPPVDSTGNQRDLDLGP